MPRLRLAPFRAHPRLRAAVAELLVVRRHYALTVKHTLLILVFCVAALAVSAADKLPDPMPHGPARQELDALLNDALQMALQLVAKHGSHMPFAMIVTPAGKRANIAADDRTVHDREVLFATVRTELTKTILQQGVRSFALAQNVRYTRRDTGESSDAVRVQLEHSNGQSVTCYLPYRITAGQPVPGEVVATDSTEKLFP
jgi:hypothetical protein